MTTRFSLLGLLAIALFAGGVFMVQLTGTPPRTVDARLDPYGSIQVHLQTEPDPPKPGGIPLMIHLTDAGGKPISVDQVKYEYWEKSDEPETLEGEATGPGSYSAVAGIKSVGEWQVRVTLFKGSQQSQVKFVLRVMPNF